MNTFTFAVPLPPSDNSLYANNLKSGKGRFETKECKAFKKEAAYCFMKAKLPRNQTRKFWRINLLCYMDARRYAIRDLSNCFKALLDSIAEWIGSDDRFLISLNAEKLPGARNEIKVNLSIGDEAPAKC